MTRSINPLRYHHFPSGCCMAARVFQECEFEFYKQLNLAGRGFNAPGTAILFSPSTPLNSLSRWSDSVSFMTPMNKPLSLPSIQTNATLYYCEVNVK